MKTSFIVIGLVILIAIISLIQASGDPQPKSNSNNSEKALMGEAVPIQGNDHVGPNQPHQPYRTNPPTSGPHFADGVAGAGIHNEEVADELLVHSLEHGAVIVSYQSEISSEDLEKVKSVFNQAEGKKILVPRKNLDVTLALTSWGRLLKLETIDQESIKAFIETNSDHAPEKAEI